MDFDQACSAICSLLRASCTGFTLKEFVKEAKANGVNHPLPVAKKLINDGVVRIDSGKNGRPTRIKATRKLFA